MILLLTHVELEMRHIEDHPWLSKKIIGCGDNCLKYADLINQDHYSTVILFGCCGLLKRQWPYLSQLYVLESVNGKPTSDEFQKHGFDAVRAKGATAKKPVHNKEAAGLLRVQGYDVVDTESAHILKICKRPLIIIRYGIDYCERKLLPTPFNHHMRKINHWLCQRKMNEVLKHIWYGYYNDS